MINSSNPTTRSAATWLSDQSFCHQNYSTWNALFSLHLTPGGAFIWRASKRNNQHESLFVRKTFFISSKEDKKCGYVRRHLTFSDLSVFPESKMSEKKKIYFGKKMIFPDFFSHTWQTDKLIRCQLSQPHRGSTCHKVASDVLKILVVLF